MRFFIFGLVVCKRLHYFVDKSNIECEDILVSNCKSDFSF